MTVDVEARERSSDEPTTIRISLPDDAVTAEMLEGRNLARNFCTDVLDVESEPTSTQAITAGEGEIVLDPAPDPSNTACVAASGVRCSSKGWSA